MKEITAFRTSDGKLFETPTAARTHEKTLAPSMLVGLTAQQIEDALDRKDVALADAIETLASIITQRRIESGEFRRKPRTKHENGQGASKEGSDAASDGAAQQEAGASAAPSPVFAPAEDAGDIPAHFDRRPKAEAP